MSEKKQLMTFHNTLYTVYLSDSQVLLSYLRGQDKGCDAHLVSLGKGTHPKGKPLRYLLKWFVGGGFFSVEAIVVQVWSSET